jgi:hypothetical protein
MSASIREINGNCMRTVSSAWQAGRKGTWWSQHREASLNWLALGVLLAAWNASDNGTAAPVRRRPEALRGYSAVSVRAATRHAPALRHAQTHTSQFCGEHGAAARRPAPPNQQPSSEVVDSLNLSLQGSQKRKRTVKLGISNDAAHACHRNQ